jgi:hypothetical protein
LLYLEASNRRWHGSIEEGISAINADLKIYYGSKRHLKVSQLYPLKKVNICAKDIPHPVLKCKAAQTRHLADFALMLAHKHAGLDRDSASRRGLA